MTAPVLEDSAEQVLCVGIITYLQSLQLLTWRTDGVYSSAFAGVAAFVGVTPQAPDRTATFTTYPVSDDVDQAMSRVGLQVRTRWAGSDPRPVGNYSGAIFDALHGLGPLILPGGASMSQCLRVSGTSMGQDPDKRWSWSDNYYIDFHRPSSNRS